MRSYEVSHPWITFQLDLRRAPHTLWLLLGEAQSKVQHVAGVPLLPAVQESFHQLFLAKGVLATTAIEGNTLTEEEVLKHLEGKLEVPRSKEYLKQEIENIIVACNEIAENVTSTNSSGTRTQGRGCVDEGWPSTCLSPAKSSRSQRFDT